MEINELKINRTALSEFQKPMQLQMRIYELINYNHSFVLQACTVNLRD